MSRASVPNDTLAQQRLREFFDRGTTTQFKRDEIIIHAGEAGELTDVYYIVNGYIKVYTLGRDGTEHLQLIDKPGEFFPGRWMIGNPDPELYYEALVDTTTYKRKRGDMLEAITQDPLIMEAVSEVTNTVFGVFINRVKTMQEKTARDKIISRLFFLAQRFGERQNGNTVITCPLTHQDIGNSIGLSRETTSRELEKLMAQQVVAYTPQHLLTIPDTDRLRDLLD